jgi:hypothetical protein
MNKTLMFSDTQCLDAALIMFRNTPETKHCSFLFVEGEDDEKFWNGHIAEKCHIVFVTNFVNNNQKKTGKLQVIENIRLLNTSKSNIKGYLGIVDNDFDSLLGIQQENNICVTETHDLETLLLSFSDVFKKLLSEYGDSQEITDFEKVINKNIHDYLIELALRFAKIEWIKRNTVPDLDIKNIHPRNSINSKWNIDEDKLNSLILEKGIDINSVKSKEINRKIERTDPYLLCNGHTVVDILSLAFDSQYGAVLGKNRRATSDNIASSIRLAIDKIELYQTQLCQAIFNWQNNNSPYQILT